MVATATKKASPVLGFDPEFGQRLCGEEPYRPEGTGDGFVDERFGGMVNENTYRLRDALPEMVNNARDPEVAEVLREAGIENPFAPFTLHVLGEPFKVTRWRDNRWHADGKLRGLRYQITAPDKEQLTDKLIRLSQRVQAESIHELTAQEKIGVVRKAQSGDVAGAIADYLRLAIGEERANQYENPTAMLADPKLAAVFDEAAMLVWFAARPNVEDSEEFHVFLQQYRGGRPLNLDLLDAAWHAFGQRETPNFGASLLPPKKEPTPAEVQAGIEDLTDSEVQKLWKAVARAAR